MRQRTLAASASLLVVAGGVVTTGPAQLRPWMCQHGQERAAVSATLRDHYDSCRQRPVRVSDPVDGSKDSTAHADWAELREVSVAYADGSLRFVLIGREHEGSGWQVVGPEGTGP